MRGGNHDGKNKEHNYKLPPYLHAILLFPNYLQVQYPIFHSTQYFPDSRYTLSSAPMTTGLIGHLIGIFCFLPLEKNKQQAHGGLMASMSYLLFSKRLV